MPTIPLFAPPRVFIARPSTGRAYVKPDQFAPPVPSLRAARQRLILHPAAFMLEPLRLKHAAAAQAFLPEPDNHPPPSGEIYAEFRARVLDAWEDPLTGAAC